MCCRRILIVHHWKTRCRDQRQHSLTGIRVAYMYASAAGKAHGHAASRAPAGVSCTGTASSGGLASPATGLPCCNAAWPPDGRTGA